VTSPKSVVIPCERLPDVRVLIEEYAEALKSAAPGIGTHGLNNDDFRDSGLFGAAIERLRGQQAASMAAKRHFLECVLDQLKRSKRIKDFSFTGHGDRHDYRVNLNDGRTSIFEAKGCLDGNNTTIWTRPADADEFVIWSLCQNPGSDPRLNAWSGIHTRIGAKIVAERTLVDGLIIWDMICGTKGRPCPKLATNLARGTTLRNGKLVPPPCLYLFPRTVPDPRNNPNPKTRKLAEVGLLKALYDAFRCAESDVTEVGIEARMQGADVERRTVLRRQGKRITQSDWTVLKQAK